MKIRLQITQSPGDSFTVEHAGPSLRLGRDPESELALGGETSQNVSWNHARIELTPAGAFLTDLNSTNGTFLNDKRISGRTPFKLGDQIQLGHTGPMLKVVDLELAPAEAASVLPPVGEPTVRMVGATARMDPVGGQGASGMLTALQRTQR